MKVVAKYFVIIIFYYLFILLAEFSSQLPHDGGAFYSNESVDGVRPYYRSAWPPMLYAAALWLSYGGFDKVGEEEMNGTDDSPTSVNITSPTTTPTKTVEVINTDRFYLLLGKNLPKRLLSYN